MRFALGMTVLSATLASCALPRGEAPQAVPAGAMGQRPGYLQVLATSVPNEAAVGRKIFTPGLDDDFVPQGLAVVGAHILVSSYKPTPNLDSNNGPCRVFRVEARTGKPAGQFDLPLEHCNSHAGGMAYLGDGRLVLADTWMLSIVDLPKALAAGTAAGAIRTVKIRRDSALRGSFAGADGRDAWIGHWSREAGKSKAFMLPPDFFERHAGTTVDESATVASMPIPVESQGIAFDPAGNVWTTTSRSNTLSKLYRIDRKGNVGAEYDMPIGLEGIAFDAAGKLWTMTESGTRKYLRWGDQFNFPFVFEVDVAKLK
ncbi:MAG: hypothetical protein M3R58_06335 [Pseudomonadota bacterium]|nr:hypothetical protein [Pseudomonadota bacterium]